jgi:hypothetical protein
LGFGLAGIVLHTQAGAEGLSAFLAVVVCAFAMTGVFVSVAALLAQASAARRARVLALARVVWFVAVLLYDVAILGIASLLRSGHASRLLIVAALVNPVDAARTVTLMAIEGAAAFGAASQALLRFTGGPATAAALAAASLAAWGSRLCCSPSAGSNERICEGILPTSAREFPHIAEKSDQLIDGTARYSANIRAASRLLRLKRNGRFPPWQEHSR